MADRTAKERKLVALMLNDLGTDLGEQEMVRMEKEVRALDEEDLDRTLAGRLDLPFPVDAEVLHRALARVAEPERSSEIDRGGFTGAADLSHDARPEEREDR